MPTDSSNPACRVCGERLPSLIQHLAEAHNLSVEDYLGLHPQSPLISGAVRDAVRTSPTVKRAHPPDPTQLSVPMGPMRVHVNHDVPEKDCLPLPEAYRLPQEGELTKDCTEAIRSLGCGRSTYIWGPTGCGKDALVHYFSHTTRRPGLIFNIDPSADIQAWSFSREFNREGTMWEEGQLLRALRDGYTTSTGRVIPYLILLTDLDRAVKEQMEMLRLVTDSIQGRIKGPMGVTYKVLPGTLIVATANTAGGGDERGFYTSSNVIDTSILGRFNRAYQFHMIDWKDEEPIVKAKFPLLVERVPGIFPQVGRAVKALRDATANDSLYTEFSHRDVCNWMEAAVDIIATSPTIPRDLLARSFRVIVDKLRDQETRTKAYSLVSTHIAGGALPKGGV